MTINREKSMNYEAKEKKTYKQQVNTTVRKSTAVAHRIPFIISCIWTFKHL